MKKIIYRQNEILIDDEDFEKVKKWPNKWIVGKRGYMFTRYQIGSGHKNRKMVNVYLHHFLFGKPPLEMVTDHINRNKLDNRKKNLRFVTKRENNINRDKRKKCTSKYIGISWFKPIKKWRAYTFINKKQIFFGYFESEEEAKRKYDKEIKRYRP